MTVTEKKKEKRKGTLNSLNKIQPETDKSSDHVIVGD